MNNPEINSRLRNLIRKSQFDASFPYQLAMLFLNPFFFVRRNLYRKISKYAGHLHGKLLDAGCGCKPYRKLFDHCSGYIGMDIENPGHSHEMEDIDVYYDGLHFPFEDESFDSVFSSEVFEHAQHLDQIIQEINRVLRAGGKLLVSVPFVWNEHELPYDYRRYTSCGIKKLLESHGFQVMKMSKSTGYVEMIFQLWMEYVRSATQEKKRCYQIAAHILLIVPAAVAGAALAGLLPENDSLYGDTVVLCRKRKQSVKEQG